MTSAKPRVNGSMLTKFYGQNVCLLGMVTSVDRSGMSFEMTASDKQAISVRLQDPLQEMLHGLVEIHGKVSSRNELACVDYLLFSDEMSQNFDMEAYNKAITMMHMFPDQLLNTNFPAEGV